MNLKQRIIHEDGTVEDIDDRTVAETLDACRARLMAACEASILEAAPEHTQRNAALGLLSDAEKAQVCSAISVRRQAFQALRQVIQSLADGWNGQEATRASVCDAIQAVTWVEP
jgi:predicted transcriptional regulator